MYIYIYMHTCIYITSASAAPEGRAFGSRIAGWQGSRMRWTGKPVNIENASAKVPPESAYE